MAEIFRGEKFSLTFAPETTYGGATSPANAYVNQVAGIFESANLPDPTMDWQKFYGFATGSTRNYYRAYKGKVGNVGGLGDVQLLNGVPLRYGIGKCVTEGTDKGSGGASTLNGAVAAGATTVTMTDATGYAQNDYIQIGVYTVTGDDAEVRKISNVNGQILTLDYPLSYAHDTLEVCNEVIAPYTHTIFETYEIPSMAWLATMQATDYSGADKATFLTRRYLGGKVGRQTISCSEGETLRLSWDEVVFKDWRHNQATYTDALSAAHNQNKYDANVAEVTPDYPSTEPYFFSYGVCSFYGFVFARIKQFRLEISNNLEPKYYVSSTAGAGQIPYEVREGRREYRIGATVDLGDEAVATKMAILSELDAQGVYPTTASGIKGFDISLVFTRGSNDTITFTLPPSAAAIGGDTQGCLLASAPHNISPEAHTAVDLDIIARSSKIVVVDSEYLYV